MATKPEGSANQPQGAPVSVPAGKKTAQVALMNSAQHPASKQHKPKRFAAKQHDTQRPASKQHKPQHASNNSRQATPARLAALDVVRTVRQREAFVQDILAAKVDNNKALVPADRAFATRLSIGVVQCKGTLDELINRALNNPHDVKDDVRDCLELGTYEIIFLQKPAHVAVSQGVELVRSVAPKATKLANFVLHRVSEMKASFPFGNPDQSLEAAARLYAFPLWLAQLLEQQMGPEAARLFMQASNQPAPVFLACNPCKPLSALSGSGNIASDGAAPDSKNSGDAANQQVQKLLDKAKVAYRQVPLGKNAPSALLLQDRKDLQNPQVKRLLSQGNILVADAASQLVAASVLPDNAPERALEIGAGRATKTVLLQVQSKCHWGKQIPQYYTLDNHAFKTKILLERARLCGVNVTDALTGDATKLAELLAPGQPFDFVFIDAPCSGLGTLRRHPEIRWRTTPEDFPQFAKTQLAMLQASAPFVAPGGTLAYATCTVSPQENAGVVKRFLASTPGKQFQLAPIAGSSHLATRSTPGSSDAHFAVRFIRKG